MDIAAPVDSAPFAEPRQPRFQWGQPVCAAADLCNDGSHPDAAADALLVPQGARGEIVQVGHHIELNLPVYLVEFQCTDGPCVVGCLEDDLQPV